MGVFLVLLPQQKDKGDDLNGFPQAHIVGQASSKVEVVQKVEPGEALQLVGAEGSLEIPGRAHSCHRLKASQPLVVAADFGAHLFVEHLLFKQIVQRRIADFGNVYFLVYHFTCCKVFFELKQPFFRQYAQGAIVEGHKFALVFH